MLITPPPYPHCVYLAFDSDRIVIYVGVTSHLFNRLYQHTVKAWWTQVAGLDIESFPTRTEANAREVQLIQCHSPINNEQFNLSSVLVEASATYGREVRVSEVREFIRAKRERKRERKVQKIIQANQEHVVPEYLTTLSSFVADRDNLTLTQMQNWRRRDKSFPVPAGTGNKGADLYEEVELEKYVASRRASV